MIWIDALGYLAAGLVLATFCMGSMLALRICAIGGNLAFIAYALLAGLEPVLVLHVLLLPVNLWRVAEIAWRARAARRTTMPKEAAVPAPRIAAPWPAANPIPRRTPTPKPRSACSRASSPSSSGRACTPAPTTRCTSSRK